MQHFDFAQSIPSQKTVPPAQLSGYCSAATNAGVVLCYVAEAGDGARGAGPGLWSSAPFATLRPSAGAQCLCPSRSTTPPLGLRRPKADQTRHRQRLDEGSQESRDTPSTLDLHSTSIASIDDTAACNSSASISLDNAALFRLTPSVPVGSLLPYCKSVKD